MILLFGFGRYLRAHNDQAFQLLCAACTCLIQTALLLDPRRRQQQSQHQQQQQQQQHQQPQQQQGPEGFTAVNIKPLWGKKSEYVYFANG